VKDMGRQQADIRAGWTEEHCTKNMDEATTKWFRLTITLIPPGDSEKIHVCLI